MSDWANFIAYGGSPEKRDKERKRKRDRYAADAEFREKKKADAKAQYEKRKKRMKRLRKAVKRRGRNKPRPYALPDGRMTMLLSLGDAADECGVSKKTLITYDTQEIIPTNRLIDTRHRRWYPREFIAFLKPLLEGQSSRRDPLWRLKQRVEQAWDEAQDGEIPILKESHRASQDQDRT